MKKLLEKIQPADLIALVLMCGGLVLKFKGIDGTVGILLTAIVVYYFGDRTILSPMFKKKEEAIVLGPIEDTIRKIAKQEGVDPDLVVRIARCESGLDPGAVHINEQGSKDRGLFQWNDKYHPEITDDIAFDVEGSTHAFCKAFKEAHLSWWDSSKKCWDV